MTKEMSKKSIASGTEVARIIYIEPAITTASSGNRIAGVSAKADRMATPVAPPAMQPGWIRGGPGRRGIAHGHQKNISTMNWPPSRCEAVISAVPSTQRTVSRMAARQRVGEGAVPP